MDSSVDSIVIDREFDEKEFKHQERRIGIIIANYEYQNLKNFYSKQKIVKKIEQIQKALNLIGFETKKEHIIENSNKEEVLQILDELKKYCQKMANKNIIPVVMIFYMGYGFVKVNYVQKFKIDIMPQFPDYKQYSDLQSLTPSLQEILKVKSCRLGLFFEGVRNLSKQDQFYEIEFYKDKYQFQEEQQFGTDSMGIFVYEDFQLQENFGNFQECKLVQDVLQKLKTISLYNDDDEELEMKNFRNFCFNLKNFKHFTQVHMVGSNDINFYLDNYFKRTREISKETFKEWTFNQCQEGLKKMKKFCQGDCQQGYYGHFYINDFFKIYPNYGIGVGCSYCKQLCQEINDEIISKFEKVFKRKFVSTNILEMKSDKNIFMNQAVSRIDKENK